MPTQDPFDFRIAPTNNAALWRYMDLSKFVSLLQTQEIYFARADTLGDPFEGSVGTLNVREADLILQFRDTIPHLAGWKNIPENQIRRIHAQKSEFRQKTTKQVYVSCWHMNEYESAAMWKLYSQSSDAICIQTHFDKLTSEFPDWVHPSMVQYINYDTHFIPTGNILHPFVHKWASFNHEQELRFIIWPGRIDGEPIKDISIEGPSSVNVNVDLSRIIEGVRVSPTAASWFLGVVQGLVEKYGLSVRVQQSGLNGSALY
jgi:hypothetical protein